MIRTLAWKEVREHRSIWIALASLTGIVIVLLVQLLEPYGHVPQDSDKAAIIVFLAMALATTYGLVCGAMMLAGEHEAGTLPFLDALTGHRLPVWKTKYAVGIGLALVQALWIALVLGLVTWQTSYAGVSLVLPLIVLVPLTLEAFAWGLFFSGLYRSVLAAAGVTAVVLTLVWMLTIMLSDLGPAVLLLRVVLIPGVAWASWRRFCRDDRSRIPTTRYSVAGGLTLLWLCWQQARRPALLLLAGSLVLGWLVGHTLVAAWPLTSLVIGLACGIGVFASEQMSGSMRFLGDQRYPVGRVWWAKVGLWLLVGVSAAAILFLIGLTQLATLDSTRTGILLPWFVNPGDLVLESNLLRWHMFERGLDQLVLWLLYGFSIAQFFGLLVRKTSAAVVLSILVGPTVLALWLPSLICGGLYAWQLWIVPLLFLAATRLAMWSWVSGQLQDRKVVARLAGWGVLAAGCIAGSLWYRVAQIPYAGMPFDVGTFEASIPSPENNRAGQLIRGALQELQLQEQRVTKELSPPQTVGGSSMSAAPAPMMTPEAFPPAGLMMAEGAAPLAEGDAAVAAALVGLGATGWSAGFAPLVPDEAAMGAAPTVPPLQGYRDRVWVVIEHDWPKEDKELGLWLDGIFKGEWVDQLRQVANYPAGVLEDPRTLNLFSLLPRVQHAAEMAHLLAARAKQLQARGDSQGALEQLSLMLALSRTLRRDAVGVSYQVGLGVEKLALDGLDSWHARLGKDPQLRKRAFAELGKHEENIPPLSQAVKADYLVVWNTFSAPPSWMLLGSPPASIPAYPGVELGIGIRMVATAMHVPWENERWTRIVNRIFGWLLEAVERDGVAQAANADADTSATYGAWIGHEVQDLPGVLFSIGSLRGLSADYQGETLSTLLSGWPKIRAQASQNRERLRATLRLLETDASRPVPPANQGTPQSKEPG